MTKSYRNQTFSPHANTRVPELKKRFVRVLSRERAFCDEGPLLSSFKFLMLRFADPHTRYSPREVSLTKFTFSMRIAIGRNDH